MVLLKKPNHSLAEDRGWGGSVGMRVEIVNTLCLDDRA